MKSDPSYNIRFPDYVRAVISRLAEEGFDAYAVGGCVRDSILERTPHDWDITTDAVPDEVMRIFAEGDIHVISTAGVRHGTVMVKAWDEVCEITTFRCDGDYNDHRRPDSVTFSKTVEDDLARRDFTMNAIAAKPCDGGAIIKDPFGGEADIAAGIIRTVGDPTERFSEDALRIMRAVRFSAELGFAVEPETVRSAIELRHTLEYVSAERITSELWRILCAPYADRVVDVFGEIFDFIVTGLTKGRYPRFVGVTDDPCVRLALMSEHGSDGAELFDRLRFSGDVRRLVTSMLSIEQTPKSRRDVCTLMRLFGSRLSTVAEYLRILCLDGTVTDGLAGAELMAESYAVEADGVPCFPNELAIRGGDVISCGIEAVRVGECLEYLLAEVQEGRVSNDPESLLRAVIAKYRTE